MNAAMEELVDEVTEFVQHTAGRPLSAEERATVGRLLEGLDEVRHRLALALVTSPAEGVRIAMGHEQGGRA